MALLIPAYSLFYTMLGDTTADLLAIRLPAVYRMVVLASSHAYMRTYQGNADHIHLAIIGYRHSERINLLSSFRHAPEYLFYSSRRSLT